MLMNRVIGQLSTMMNLILIDFGQSLLCPGMDLFILRRWMNKGAEALLLEKVDRNLYPVGRPQNKQNDRNFPGS